MPTITLTLTDTPQGGVSVQSTFQPAIGMPLSRAQAVALEIFTRTRKDWGIEPPASADADIQRRVLCSAMEVAQ